MENLEAPAVLANLEKLIAHAVGFAGSRGFTGEALSEVRLASEEALVNVINYAYQGGQGNVTVSCGEAGAGGIKIEISDAGVPFDPLSRPAPDTTLPMEQRKIGGLGILMIRKSMDEVTYRRENGRNILMMVKFAKKGN